ncbi:hypothetical protein P692DRAFT_20269346 [Suillus brevipes Sb2]|nr:hypothetical protein P692DRAFT_20269346 [Suillus brevipes Sb2]
MSENVCILAATCCRLALSVRREHGCNISTGSCKLVCSGTRHRSGSIALVSPPGSCSVQIINATTKASVRS